VLPSGGTVRGGVGSPSYVAPEIVMGEEYGLAVDMWAVGVISYIMYDAQNYFLSSSSSSASSSSSSSSSSYHHHNHRAPSFPVLSSALSNTHTHSLSLLFKTKTISLTPSLGGYTPFNNDNPRNPLNRQILNADFEFHDEEWSEVGPQARVGKLFFSLLLSLSLFLFFFYSPS